jgi:hypothetical protein
LSSSNDKAEATGGFVKGFNSLIKVPKDVKPKKVLINLKNPADLSKKERRKDGRWKMENGKL